jgi:hypothetical protein
MSELREALAQAMSSSDDAEENESNSVISPPENLSVESSESSNAENDSHFNESNDASNDEPNLEKEESGEKEYKNSSDQNNERQADTSSKVEKPPVGWTPESREHWAKLPDNVRKQISKREVEVNKLLQDTSNARRLHQEFNRTVEPYKSLMASQGVNNPLQAVNGLLETAAALSMGSQTQKAQRLAGLIKHYGIDIETLDEVLSGEAPQQRQQNQMNPDIENLINQRLAPYEQERQQRQQQQDYQVKQRAASSVNAIANKEFFNDVRMDMADIVEMSTKRGQHITMEQAYERAVSMSVDIQKVIRGRNSSSELNHKQNAAVGIRGNRSNVPSDAGNLDLRSQLEANWNTASTGRT